MALNKTTGNMYPWVTHTFNPIRGQCPHRCSYCYAPHTRAGHLYQGKPQLVEKAFSGGLGKGKTIFVGSMIDMWVINARWEGRVLRHCKQYPENTYLFQTKNPYNFIGHIFPPQTILGTTIETDNADLAAYHSQAPYPAERAVAMAYLKKYQRARTMVSIEPIMEFSLTKLVRMVRICEPEFVSIGANSRRNISLSRSDIPSFKNTKGGGEPSPDQVGMLIKELGEFTEVRVKPNLSRIVDGDQ